jgi:hypothetical protein
MFDRLILYILFMSDISKIIVDMTNRYPIYLICSRCHDIRIILLFVAAGEISFTY